MRNILKATLSILLILQVVDAHAIYPYDGYLAQFKKLMLNCSMNYDMSYAYPDSTSLKIHGRMAVAESRFYDSSNVRFVLLDDKWLVAADHLEKFIAIEYLPSIQREIGNMGNITATSYLFSEDNFDKNMRLQIVKENADTVWVSVSLENDKMLKELVISLARKTMLPLGYQLKLNMPMGQLLPQDENPAGFAEVELSCYDLKFPAASALFDHRRIILEDGKKATLRKFNNYQTFLSKPKNK